MALAAGLLSTGPAWGFWNDRFIVYAEETVTWDSNVFRLSRNRDPVSDRSHVHTVGFTADVPWSLQRFQASFARFWTRYQRLDRLDFDGRIGRAAWLWAITPRLTGDLGYSEDTSLASFATFGGTTKDVMKTRQAFASATWEVAPSWLAYAGYVGTERKHGDPTRRGNDLRANSGEVRMSYVTSAENRIGVSVRVEDGASPETTIVRGLAFDNGYRQAGVGVVARWTVTGHSRLDGRVDYVRRRYDQFSERNYSGPTAGITHTWTPTGKLTFVSTLRRDIAPLDDVQTTFVLVDAVGVKPKWSLTEKFDIIGSVDYARWKYRNDPLTGGDYEHRIRGAALGLLWRPFLHVAIQGNAQREIRTSELANADYRVNLYTLDARIGF